MENGKWKFRQFKFETQPHSHIATQPQQLCGYVALWLCSCVAMLLLCGYVAKWLCGPPYTSKFRLPSLHQTVGPIGAQWSPLGARDGHLYAKCYKLWISQKLRRIILLHIGMVIFDLTFPKSEHSSCSCFSDLVDMTMTLQTHYA